MTRSHSHAETSARFAALDAALRETTHAARPEYTRRFAALALLNAQDEPRSLARRASDAADDLIGAPGIAKAARPVFAASLVAAGRSADDYLRARQALAGVLRKSLPVAALAYAAAGRTEIDSATAARIEAIAPLVRAPWWSDGMARNGFYAAALALTEHRIDAVEARVQAARRALEDAGAGGALARDHGRLLALADAEPVAAARTWSKLKEQRGPHGWRGLRPAMLVGLAAAAGGDAEAAARALDAAYETVRDLRPRASSVARPFLAAGLATHQLRPAAPTGESAVSGVQATLAIIAAHAASTAAIAASTAAVVASM